jgi:Ca2+-binding EF-hand superfamily protein
VNRISDCEWASNCSAVTQLVHSIMETFDVDKDGFLNYKEFCCLMGNAGLQLYNL